MKKYSKIYGFLAGLLGLLVFFSLAQSEGSDPDHIVLLYYQALKERRFEEAYGYLSQEKRGDKTLDQWVTSTREAFEEGKVDIQKISVSSAEVHGNRSLVRSKVVATDIFNVKGLIEYNREHLVKEGGHWKLEKTEFLTVEVIE